MRRLVPVLAAAAALAACGGSAGAAAQAPCRGATPPAQRRHVIWIWLENTGYGGAIGNRTAPYLNRLANGCGLATDYRAVAHPSLPNYLAATSGGTWGVSDDEPPAAHTLAQPSIFDRLAAAGRSWRSYEESMPSNCALDGSGLYAVKHNPAAYYARSRAACARWDVPLGTTRGGAFVTDLRAGRLPAFAFVTPNLCDDAHDCPLAAADRWLAAWVPRIVASPGYRSGSTVVFVTFDEAEGSSNHVATVVVSPSTRPGTRSAAPFTHYSLLKTTEQLLGLRPQLGAAAAASTPSMRRAFGLRCAEGRVRLRRLPPFRLEGTPYLTTSSRWLSSGACLTIVMW